MIRFPPRLLFSRLSPPAASLWTYAPNLSPAPWPFSGHIGNATQLPCSISHFPHGRQGKRFRSVLSKWLRGAGRKSSSGVGSRVLSPGHSIWWGWADQSHQLSSDIHTLSGWAPSCGCLSVHPTDLCPAFHAPEPGSECSHHLGTGPCWLERKPTVFWACDRSLQRFCDLF